jgi:aspartate beta-hydroxylase
MVRNLNSILLKYKKQQPKLKTDVKRLIEKYKVRGGAIESELTEEQESQLFQEALETFDQPKPVEPETVETKPEPTPESKPEPTPEIIEPEEPKPETKKKPEKIKPSESEPIETEFEANKRMLKEMKDDILKRDEEEEEEDKRRQKEGTIKNPKTGRMIKIDGKEGQRLLIEDLQRREIQRNDDLELYQGSVDAILEALGEQSDEKDDEIEKLTQDKEKSTQLIEKLTTEQRRGQEILREKELELNEIFKEYSKLVQQQERTKADDKRERQLAKAFEALSKEADQLRNDLSEIEAKRLLEQDKLKEGEEAIKELEKVKQDLTSQEAKTNAEKLKVEIMDLVDSKKQMSDLLVAKKQAQKLEQAEALSKKLKDKPEKLKIQLDEKEQALREVIIREQHKSEQLEKLLSEQQEKIEQLEKQIKPSSTQPELERLQRQLKANEDKFKQDIIKLEQKLERETQAKIKAQQAEDVKRQREERIRENQRRTIEERERKAREKAKVKEEERILEEGLEELTKTPSYKKFEAERKAKTETERKTTPSTKPPPPPPPSKTEETKASDKTPIINILAMAKASSGVEDDKIINPDTGRKVSINSPIGKRLLQKKQEQIKQEISQPKKRGRPSKLTKKIDIPPKVKAVKIRAPRIVAKKTEPKAKKTEPKTKKSKAPLEEEVKK